MIQVGSPGETGQLLVGLVEVLVVAEEIHVGEELNHVQRFSRIDIFEVVQSDGNHFFSALSLYQLLKWFLLCFIFLDLRLVED